MATLTFSKQPRDPKQAMKFLVRRWRLDHGDSWQWAWVMEWQTRGVVHFHVFIERDWLTKYEQNSLRTEIFCRDGRERTVIRGAAEEWFIRTWSRATHETSRAFQRFQRGGILEQLRTPDAAARYVAKEAGKRAQKQLPDGVEAAGRWWWLSPAGAHGIGRDVLLTYPLERPYKFIFDKRALNRKYVHHTVKTWGLPAR